MCGRLAVSVVWAALVVHISVRKLKVFTQSHASAPRRATFCRRHVMIGDVALLLLLMYFQYRRKC